MIYGIGVDIVSIERIKNMLEKFPEKSLKRILTKNEINDFDKIKSSSLEKSYNFFAKRFAAKEALAKAFGTGISGGLSFTDFFVKNNAQGKPEIFISENAKKILSLPENFKLHLSLSDSPPNAIAMVVVEVF